MLSLLLSVLAMPQTHEISFKGATELTLHGELMAPEGDGPFPTVLLMPGSGPTDRNGNQPPALTTDLLKQTAEHLAANGIATFRFDKRPVRRYASSWPITDVEKLSEFFSFENHIADATAAYEAMKAHGLTDDSKLAILGHSEGGLFASWMASKVKPKALVLAATAGDTMVSVLRFQIGRNLSQPGVPESLRAEITQANEEAMKTIIEEGRLPEKVHPQLAPLYNASALKLLRSYLTIDPTVPLKEYTGPVLVINGDKDIQVRADVDAQRLYKALQERSTGTQELAIIAGASHNFKEVKSPLDPAFAGPVVPAALTKITAWIKKALG